MGKVGKVQQYAIWERGTHLTGSTDEACRGARSRWDSLMGYGIGDGQEEPWKAPGREGTWQVRRQAVGCSVLLYVCLRARVNVRPGEGGQGNGVVATCWQLVARSSPRPYSHCTMP